MKTLSLLALALLLLSGCASKIVKIPDTNPTLIPQYQPPQKEEALKSEEVITDANNEDAILMALYDEYAKWNQTPYKYGGTDKYGIDCSSLVQQVYFNALRVPLPRTTILQSKIGYRVQKHKSKTGDLLLFKTGYNTGHSGIYLKDGDFINASSRHGVTISNINNPYWKSKYWQTRRILP